MTDITDRFRKVLNDILDECHDADNYDPENGTWIDGDMVGVWIEEVLDEE